MRSIEHYFNGNFEEVKEPVRSQLQSIIDSNYDLETLDDIKTKDLRSIRDAISGDR